VAKKKDGRGRGRQPQRRHPTWQPARPGLDQARVEPDVWFMTHVLGDGDDYLVGVTLPSGHALSALVYVDHNLGTVVKDAFVIPEPLEDLAIKMGTLIAWTPLKVEHDAGTATFI